MNKKYLLVFLALLFLVFGGAIFWFSRRPTAPLPPVSPEIEQPEEPEDEISSLLTSLKKETEIDFSEIKDVEIKWVVEVEPKVQEKTIAGKSFEVEGISSQQAKKVETFLKNKGFEIDLYNMADGTVAGLKGYKKDQARLPSPEGEANGGQVVCTIAEGATGYKEAIGRWIPPEPEKRDVEVKCGLLNASP